MGFSFSARHYFHLGDGIAFDVAGRPGGNASAETCDACGDVVFDNAGTSAYAAADDSLAEQKKG